MTSYKSVRSLSARRSAPSRRRALLCTTAKKSNMDYSIHMIWIWRRHANGLWRVLAMRYRAVELYCHPKMDTLRVTVVKCEMSYNNNGFE